MNSKEITALRNVLSAAIQKAGKVVLTSRKRISIASTSAHDLVTTADHKSDGLLIATLKNHFPKIAVYSEESGGEKKFPKELLAIFDGIDGTINYSSGSPIWGISGAIHENGIPIAAAICQPALNKFFSMTAYKTATVHRQVSERKLSVSKKRDLETARVCTEWKKGNSEIVYDILRILFENTMCPQIFVCCTFSIMLVAEGILDGCVASGPTPEDVAAAIPILEAAGGRVTDLDGNPYDIFSGKVMVASNGHIHKALLKTLESIRK
ncbi:MAG: inositol monophosphatase [Candidatus Paceibacterota bacterium]|jgi:myo-inositol-1(or 4)-monophosphatase